ncbi:MAG: diguanylate cyclase [Bryobacteraceae bacterium]
MGYVSSHALESHSGAHSGGGWEALSLSLIEYLREYSTFIKEDERDELRLELDEVLRVLRDHPSESVIGTTTETLTRKVPQYFQQTQKEIDGSLSELRQLASLLMATLAQMHDTDQGTTASLVEIGQLVQSARGPGELAVAKIHLVQALERLHTKTAEKREAHRPLPSALQEKAQASGLAPALEASRQRSAGKKHAPTEQSLAMATGSADPITGLRGRQACEAFLMSLTDSAKSNTYIAVFYVQRIELINSRFGDRTGSDVLRYCAQRFAKLMKPSDQLFRWRGPGFVASLERGLSLSEVKHEVNSGRRNRMTFERADNSVIIPLSIVTQVWPARGTHAAEMIHTIENFLSLPSTRAYVDGIAEAEPESKDAFTVEET